jgi:hypothetical protein
MTESFFRGVSAYLRLVLALYLATQIILSEMNRQKVL